MKKPFFITLCFCFFAALFAWAFPVVVWQQDGSEAVNPGDLLQGTNGPTGANEFRRLAIGANNQVLTVSNGFAFWHNSQGGSGGGTVGTLINTANTAAGDIVAFGDTTKTNTQVATSANLQAALGQAYQGTNGNLTLWTAYSPAGKAATNTADAYQKTNANLTLWQTVVPSSYSLQSDSTTVSNFVTQLNLFTNAYATNRQFGSANLTNWSGLPTNALGTMSAEGTNSWQRGINNGTYVTSVTNSGTGRTTVDIPSRLPSAILGTNAITSSIGITVDGGGSVITTGTKGYFTMPYDFTVYGYYLIGDQSGTLTVDVWYTNIVPTVTHTIVGNQKPTLTSAITQSNLVVSAWFTNFTAGSTVGYAVDGSPASVTRATLIIVGRK